MEDYAEKLAAKVAPDSVATTLIRAGCFLSAYELIKTEIVDRVHSFFWSGFDNGKHLYMSRATEREYLAAIPRVSSWHRATGS